MPLLNYTTKVGQAIWDTPTADVVEVVRCKNCKHFGIRKGNVLGVCKCQSKIKSCGGGNLFPKENDYCSYGERRADNNVS